MGRTVSQPVKAPSANSRGKLPLIAAVVFLMAAAIGWWMVGSNRATTTGMNDNPATTGRPWFEECAASSGIDFRHTRGRETRYFFPEIISGGCGLFDYDNDGDLDAYLVQGGELDPAAIDDTSCALYRNRGDGTFENVTAAAGVAFKGYGMGCSAGDYDNDGDIDLYVTAYGGNALYQNQGNGTFKDVTESAGVRCGRWSASAAFADYDADGHLDLYVANYVSWTPQTEIYCRDGAGRRDYCQPSNYNAPAPDTLFRNLGDGRFEDVSQKAGLLQAFGNGLGICHGDFNHDGHLDFYVANDGMPNQLWLNQGNGTFENEALYSGCAVNSRGVAEAGMGVQAVDIEGDGDLDFYITHIRGETNTVFINDAGLFEDLTSATGLGGAGMKHTGWGLGFHDFNHDGLLDVFIANGSVTRPDRPWDPADPYVEPKLLYQGQPHRKFVEVSPQGGTSRPVLGSSRSAAFGDVDHDGDVDLLVVEQNGPARLFRNVAGSNGSWAMFRVMGKHGREAIGASLEVLAGDARLHRQVASAYSYGAANDSRVHVGLGRHEQVDRVIVHWPEGAREAFGPFPARKLHIIRQGEGTPYSRTAVPSEQAFIQVDSALDYHVLNDS